MKGLKKEKQRGKSLFCKREVAGKKGWLSKELFLPAVPKEPRTWAMGYKGVVPWSVPSHL